MMETETTRETAARRFIRYVKLRTAAALRRDSSGWMAASGGVTAVWTAALAVYALGIPTGLGYAFDAAVLIVFGLIGLWAAGIVLAVIFSLAMMPIPRLFAGISLSSAAGMTQMLSDAEMGWAAALPAVAAAAAGAAAGGLAAALVQARRRPLRAAAAAISAAAAVVLLLSGTPYAPNADPGTKAERWTAAEADEAAARIRALGIDDPAEPGPHAFTSFTYGSGTDRRRPEYGPGAAVMTGTVDASQVITKWPALRTRFWGFGPRQLPLNGRVWMPDGDGPYPLVLMVHGNHLMEHYSDGGYGYLGELLASRGIIAVSVDENFLNYSAWSGIPNQDMKLRAWILLHHLREIAELSRTPGTPFAGRVDLGAVGLIGHSRGGQAAAMAADYARWFKDDPTLTGIDTVHIAAVAAIAPTDMAVDNKRANLRNVHYLTIHGSRDADLQNFYGDRQYARTTFDRGRDGFKSALYLDGANHVHFNTDWGRFDLSLPGGILLNRQGVMDGREQRRAAAAFIGAFMEAALNGRSGYESLFSDPLLRRHAAGTAVFGRYEHSSFRIVSRFESADVRSLRRGAEAEAEGASHWAHEPVLNRDGNNRGYKGLTLAWEKEAAYRIAFDWTAWPEMLREGAAAISFSMADLSHEVEAGGDYAVEVEVEWTDGEAVRLPLGEFGKLNKPPHVTFTVHRFLERRYKKGKYKSAVEPVFETFIVPLAPFRKMRAESGGEIQAVVLHFAGGPGKAVIDDFGFYPERTGQ